MIKLKLGIEKQVIESLINLKDTDICLDLDLDLDLDLGCGVGYWSEFFGIKSKSVIGVDYSEKMISTAKKNAI